MRVIRNATAIAGHRRRRTVRTNLWREESGPPLYRGGTDCPPKSPTLVSLFPLVRFRCPLVQFQANRPRRPNHQKSKSARTPMPTRNKNGCIVMVEYDHLLLEHLRAGHTVDSFDTRKLRRRPAESPRERWLRVQNHLLTYDVIDKSLVIPSWQARTRRSPSPQASSPRSKRRRTPARESSTSQVNNSPGTVDVADSISSQNHPWLSPKRSTGEIPSVGAVEVSKQQD